MPAILTGGGRELVVASVVLRGEQPLFRVREEVSGDTKGVERPIFEDHVPGEHTKPSEGQRAGSRVHCSESRENWGSGKILDVLRHRIGTAGVKDNSKEGSVGVVQWLLFPIGQESGNEVRIAGPKGVEGNGRTINTMIGTKIRGWIPAAGVIVGGGGTVEREARDSRCRKWKWWQESSQCVGVMFVVGRTINTMIGTKIRG